MSVLRSLVDGLRGLFGKDRIEQEMDEELRGYLDAAVKEKMRAGASREEAWRAAKVEMGSMEMVKEEIRSAGWEAIWGLLATGNYLDVLDVYPLMDRFFHQADDLHPGASPYAVLSYNAWRSRFGADSGIVGKTVRINRLPYTVLGVPLPIFTVSSSGTGPKSGFQ